MELKVEISNIPLKNEKLDALIVFVAEDTNVYGSGLSGLPDELKKLLNASLKLKVFSGKKAANSILFQVIQKSHRCWQLV